MTHEENERQWWHTTTSLLQTLGRPSNYGAMVELEEFRWICGETNSSRRCRAFVPIAISFLVLCCVLSLLRSPSPSYASHIEIHQHKRFFRKGEARVGPLVSAFHHGSNSPDGNRGREVKNIATPSSPVIADDIQDGRSLEIHLQEVVSRERQEREVETPVPIFSFYHDPSGSGTIPDGDSRLIQEWVLAWSSQGYNARVLTMDDAKKHPDFEEYADAIDYLLSSGPRRRKPELRDCYLRYLAVAAAQGGMMVDLDTRPSHTALESQRSPPDKFTVYCGMVTGGPDDWLRQVEPQNGLPCSVHASPAEWTRVAKLLGWASKQFDNLKEWTDMHSLLYLARFGEIDVVEEKHVDSWRTSSWSTCYFRHV